MPFPCSLPSASGSPRVVPPAAHQVHPTSCFLCTFPQEGPRAFALWANKILYLSGVEYRVESSGAAGSNGRKLADTNCSETAGLAGHHTPALSSQILSRMPQFLFTLPRRQLHCKKGRFRNWGRVGSLNKQVNKPEMTLCPTFYIHDIG